MSLKRWKILDRKRRQITWQMCKELEALQGQVIRFQIGNMAGAARAEVLWAADENRLRVRNLETDRTRIICAISIVEVVK